jgi:hypothetical protein
MKLDGTKKNMFRLLESIDKSFKSNINEISPEYVAKKTMTGYGGDDNKKNIDNGRVANALKISIDANLKDIYGTQITKLYVITDANPVTMSNSTAYLSIDLQLNPQYENYEYGDASDYINKMNNGNYDRKLHNDHLKEKNINPETGKFKLKQHIKYGINIFIEFDDRMKNGEDVNGRFDNQKPYTITIIIDKYLNDIIKHFGDRSDLGKIRQIIRKLIPEYNINLNDIPLEVSNNNKTDQQKLDSFD